MRPAGAASSRPSNDHAVARAGAGSAARTTNFAGGVAASASTSAALGAAALSAAPLAMVNGV